MAQRLKAISALVLASLVWLCLPGQLRADVPARPCGVAAVHAHLVAPRPPVSDVEDLGANDGERLSRPATPSWDDTNPAMAEIAAAADRPVRERARERMSAAPAAMRFLAPDRPPRFRA